MKFTIVDAEQRSDAWFAARAARVTGSKADCVVAKGKGGAESVQRRDYRADLACERIALAEGRFVAVSDYSNAAMAHGVEKEPFARSAYEVRTGEMVEQTGFISCVDYMAGCSLDGHVGNFEKVIEIKCPYKPAVHFSYWRDPQSFVNQYAAQLAHNMIVTGAKRADLVSFDDRAPRSLQLLIVPVDITVLPLLGGYWEQVERFLAEVSLEVQEIQALAKKHTLAEAA